MYTYLSASTGRIKGLAKALVYLGCKTMRPLVPLFFIRVRDIYRNNDNGSYMKTCERKQYKKNQGTRGRIAFNARNGAGFGRPFVVEISLFRPFISVAYQGGGAVDSLARSPPFALPLSCLCGE